MTDHRMTDRQMDEIIAKLLRIGVASAAVLVLAGGIAYVASSGRAVPDFAHFHPQRKGLASIRTMAWPELLIEIGLLALIATPLARVIFCLAAFLLEHDRMYVAFTLTVLAVLLYSIGAALL
jgi:uncharacterized membrane protein